MVWDTENARVRYRLAFRAHKAVDGKTYWWENVWCYEYWVSGLQVDGWKRIWLGKLQPTGLLKAMADCNNMLPWSETKVSEYYKKFLAERSRV